MDFIGQDILSAAQFDRGAIESVLKNAQALLPYARKEKFGEILNGKVLAALFYEPSTRTRLSFETAMIRLGGRVVSAVGVQNSSLTKGETFYDTGRVINQFADVIAMRHSENGSVEKLAEGAQVPVINGGDGSNEHPTQALLDIFTIQQLHGKVDGLTIAMVGDLKYGRTVHSLSKMLSHFGVKLILVSPKELAMPIEVKKDLMERGVQLSETENMIEALKTADVLYMTRIQQERFDDEKEYEKFRDRYILTRALVEQYNKKITIMHPLPRIWELTKDVDDCEGAAYFTQVQNGVAVRMALLCMVLGVEPK